MKWTVERLGDEIDLLGSRGLPRKEFFAELSPRLRNVIDNDASCWHTLDPHTRLMTSDSPEELIERGVFAPDETQAAGELLVRSEYLVEDVNTFAGLAARRVPVGILDHATRGAPESSARYRDLLLPADIPHELRAAFVVRGRVWGAVHIARRAASGPFEPRDADALAGLANAIARGIRASLRFDAARRITGIDAPGLVVLGPRDEVELITPPARELLASMRSDGPAYADDAVATPVLALASFVRGAPEAGQGGSNVVTVPGSDGWITLHASLPGPPRRPSRRDRPRAGRRRALSDGTPRGVRRDRSRARGRDPARQGPFASGDGRGARCVAAHRRGSRQESLRQAGRRLAAGARRPRSWTSISPRWRGRRH
jgi:hypothetical protein